METLFAPDSLSVSLAIAFAFGMAARLVRLPPMIGFLLAGFALSAMGTEPTEEGQQIADFGVLLLLFLIGLKLKPAMLMERPVLGGGLSHMALTTALAATGLLIFAALGLGQFAGLDPAEVALIAFALSFSSTVFTVKVFEDKGELGSTHGKVALGILIIQDIAAVIYLVASTGKLPSIWALGLVALFLVRPLIFRVLDRMGHGEMLPLFGLFAVLVMGAALFEAVGLKPDLGALIIGMLVASHPRASEVADSLLAFKDIFLIGFFLNIGLGGLPTPEVLLTAVILLGLLPLKMGLFFFVLCLFRLRARTALLAALGLATYSEFGLIVGAIAVEMGTIPQEWLLSLALALALSFLIVSPLNAIAHDIYARNHRRLRRFEVARKDLQDPAMKLGEAEVVIFGMGRLGKAVYTALAKRYGTRVIGIETDREKVAQLEEAGINVLHGDATDSDFWRRAGSAHSSLRAVLLAMPDHRANMFALEQIGKAEDFDGFVAALARFPDELADLNKAGADVAFDVYGEAGTGFAVDILRRLEQSSQPRDVA
ncbi:MAG: cation:proton antiporter family protein [Pseudomonadota bacterium]